MKLYCTSCSEMMALSGCTRASVHLQPPQGILVLTKVTQSPLRLHYPLANNLPGNLSIWVISFADMFCTISFTRYLLQIRFARWYKNYFQEGKCFYLQCATWRNRWHLKVWIVARDRVADLLWRRREETGFAPAWRGQGQEGGREGGGRTRNPPNG